MKIADYLGPDTIFLDIPLENKGAVLRFVAESFEKNGAAKDGKALFECMKSREEVFSTGIGGGIGIPHIVSSNVLKSAILLVRLARPIDFGSIDAEPVDIILAVAVSNSETHKHLQMLAGVSSLCREAQFVQAIRSAKSPLELHRRIELIESRLCGG